MKMSEVFERAAEVLFVGKQSGCDWACNAVSHVATSNWLKDCPERDYFVNIYGKPARTQWWPASDEFKDERVLALLFAAAIARSDGE